MSAWVVEVRLEDGADSSESTGKVYGPFRSQTRAVFFAAQVGRGAGLNLNTWGSWYGTDGGDLVASVRVRPAYHTSPDSARGAVANIRNWFNDIEENESE